MNDSLLCEKENGNEYDENASAIYHNNIIQKSIIDHVPFLLIDVSTNF